MFQIYESNEKGEESKGDDLEMCITVDETGLLAAYGEYCAGTFNEDCKRRLYERLKQDYEK
jgi:hypothetical protein